MTALILADNNLDLDRAYSTYQEQESICREISDTEGIVLAKNNTGEIFRKWGEFEKALKIHEDMDDMLHNTGIPYLIFLSFANRAEILVDNFRRYKEALPFAEEAHRLYQQHKFTEHDEDWTETILKKARQEFP